MHGFHVKCQSKHIRKSLCSWHAVQWLPSNQRKFSHVIWCYKQQSIQKYQHTRYFSVTRSDMNKVIHLQFNIFTFNSALPLGSSSTWMMLPMTEVLCRFWTASFADLTVPNTTLAIPRCFLFFGLYKISTPSISPNFLHMSVRNPSLTLSLSLANVTSLGGTRPM